jgi:hypothetical protein
MFGDDYIRKIGHATETEAKIGLYYALYRRYAKDRGLAAHASDEAVAKLAAAVTNKVFGERGTAEAGPCFAAENAQLIEREARQLASDEEICACLSGAGYNASYARYLEAGGSRGMFSNVFLAYVRALSQGDATLAARYAEQIGERGKDVLAPILSMVALGIFRPLPYGPNEREFFDAAHRFANAERAAAGEGPAR